MPRKSRIRRKNNRRRTIRRKKIRGGVHSHPPHPFVASEGVDLEGYKENTIYIKNDDVYDGEGGKKIGRIQQLQTKETQKQLQWLLPIDTGSYILEDYKQKEGNNYLIWITR